MGRTASSIGRFGSTDASVSLVSITVGITVEHPSFLCDYVHSTKKHRPGISSLLLTLELCNVALSFALPYLLPPTRQVCITVHHRASPWPPCVSPGAVVLPMTIAHHTQDQIKRNHPQMFALIFYFPNM